MTKDELEKMLGDEDLFNTLDVKTLVLDKVREMEKDELMAIFWAKLPEITVDEIKDYFYMRRA